MKRSCAKLWAEADREVLTAHGATCEACRAALEAEAALEVLDRGGPARANPALASLARAELAAHPRAWGWGWQAVLAVGVELLFAGAMLAWRSHGAFAPGLAGAGRLAAPVLLLALLLAGSALALAPGRARGAGWGVALLGGGAAVAVLASASGLGPGGWQAGAPCALSLVVTSTVPVVVAVWLLRRFARSWAQTLLAGAAASASGLLAVCITCPDGAWGHVLLFHLLPWAACGALSLGARALVPSHSHSP